MNLIDNNYSYLFSSFETLPNNFFQGYCFVENDLIIGTEGAEQYHKEIPPFCDGCYISVSKVGNKHIVGVDSNGYKKIFIYQKNDIWVISNSIYQLAKFVHQKNLPLTKNLAILTGYFPHGMPSAQMNTLKTVFNEIVLLPYESCLTISNNKIRVDAKPKIEDLGYELNLKRYMEQWLSRIETLIEDNSIKILTDLTGGIDSRTMYALFTGAMNRLSLEDGPNLFLRSSKQASQAEDLAIATNIIHRFGGKLNTKAGLTNIRLSSEYSYNKWKDLNLGCYFPIYFPMIEVADDTLYFGGASGGVHRSVYGSKDLISYINNSKSKIRDNYSVNDRYDLEPLLDKYEEEVEGSLYEIKNKTNNKVDDMILLYREFRNRFHAGRSPQYGRTISPLGSDYLSACSSYCDQERLDRKQVFYDIMENLCPGLSILPYDKESKFPSYEAIKGITIIDIDEASNPGKVYRGNESSNQITAIKATQKKDVMLHLQKELIEFREKDKTKFFSEEFIQKSLKILNISIENEAFPHASEVASISQILTYSMMIDFSTS